MDTTIAVIGSTGFVGKAMCALLKSKGITPVEYHVDNSTPSATKKDVNACELAFVCVPTPMRPNGSCDLTIVADVLDWLNTPTIVIKSTVPIGSTRRMREMYGKNIIHNPEFLREATAEQDVLNPRFTVIGGKSDLLEGIYKAWFASPMILTTSDNSEAIKYAINAFLAYKVGFFNELSQGLEVLGLDPDEVIVGMLNDPRIGDSHTLVTAEGGFGGHCFPKDLNALIASMERAGYNPKLFKQLWQSNRTWREEFAEEEFNLYGKN